MIPRTTMLAVMVVTVLAPRAAFGQTDGPDPFLAHTVFAGIVVAEREAAARALTDWAEARNGYFVRRSLERVSLRVPPQSLSGLQTKLGELSFEIVAYNPGASDIRQELRAVEAGITSREEALSQILAYLEESDVRATLAFERELTALLGEIEGLEGRRRVLINRAAFARVEVSLSTQQQELPPTVASSFGWINTMGLDRFLREAQ